MVGHYTLDIADTEANEAHFGRPPSSRGDRSAFPQARMVALAECGTHAIVDAVVGPCTSSEVEFARELISRLSPGMLVLADRGLYGFNLWEQATSTGADLLFRVKSILSPCHEQTLADGSWIASIKPTSGTGRAQREPHRVRVIDLHHRWGRSIPAHHHLVGSRHRTGQRVGQALFRTLGDRDHL